MAAAAVRVQEALDFAAQKLGFEKFRDQQAAALRQLVNGSDVFIMHAGGIVSARACFCFDLTEYANFPHEGQALYSSRDTRGNGQDVVFAGRYCSCGWSEM